MVLVLKADIFEAAHIYRVGDAGKYLVGLGRSGQVDTPGLSGSVRSRCRGFPRRDGRAS